MQDANVINYNQGEIIMTIEEWEKLELNRLTKITTPKLHKIVTHEKDKLIITYIMVWTKVCGGSKIILEYANRLAKKGHEINIVTYDEKPKWFSLSNKVKFIKVPSNEDIVNYIPESDIIIPTSWKCIYKAIESNSGVVAFFEQGGSHLSDVENLSKEKRNVVAERMKLPHFIYTVSEYSRDKFKELYNRESNVIYNAIDENIFYPRYKERNSSEITITIIGSEDFKFKNIEEILKVIRVLKKKYPIKLNWITQTEPKKNKEKPIINPKQSLIGEILRDTDIYICNSEYETFGLPTLEAMACGATVITTDTGGMRDFVVDGENALVIKKHNSEDMLKKMEILIKDRNLLQKLSKKGIETAKRFSWDSSIENIERYYKEIAKYKLDGK